MFLKLTIQKTEKKFINNYGILFIPYNLNKTWTKLVLYLQYFCRRTSNNSSWDPNCKDLILIMQESNYKLYRIFTTVIDIDLLKKKTQR